MHWLRRSLAVAGPGADGIDPGAGHRLPLDEDRPRGVDGRVAGARSHSGPAREAAKEIGSSVPWIGFPIGYAVSNGLHTVFGSIIVPLAA
jgi:hypothetical protein